MTPENKVLVEVLAAIDAVWLPLRAADHDSPHANANLYESCRHYESNGVPWKSGEAKEADRRRANRRLEKMASDGFLKILNTQAKSIHVLLTDHGEELARRLADLPELWEAHLGLSVLVDFGSDGRWVNECIILNGRRSNYDKLGDYPGRLLWMHQQTMVPLLPRGLAFANSDYKGRVYYSATKTGIEWAASPAPIPAADLPPVDREAAVYFTEVLEARRIELRIATPINLREVGPCGLPCGCPMVRGPDGESGPPRRRKKQPTKRARR